jgi:hypothetical protein
MTTPPRSAVWTYKTINLAAWILVGATVLTVIHVFGFQTGLLTAIGFLVAHISDQLRQVVNLLERNTHRSVTFRGAERSDLGT